MAPPRTPVPASKPPEPSKSQASALNNPAVLDSSLSSDSSSSSSNDDSADPVTATYNVFITPQQDSLQSLYLLQFPTRSRSQPYNVASGRPASALRIKPETGFVELDVPIPTEANYDAGKARRWGEALQKTEGGEGLSLSGGFMGRRGRGLALKKEDDDMDDDVELPMSKQTLGGLVVKQEEGAPTYMMGTFRQDELHLTPMAGFVQLRPQHPHIDATSHISRQANILAAQTALNPSSQQHAPAPRAVRTTVSTTDDPYAATRRLVSAASEEPWRHLIFTDQDSERAYDVYHQKMFSSGGPDGTEGREKLVSRMGREEYLNLLCEGLGGDEKVSSRARSRRRKKARKEREKGKGKARADDDVLEVE